jgi:hypothetical protein
MEFLDKHDYDDPDFEDAFLAFLEEGVNIRRLE